VTSSLLAIEQAIEALTIKERADLLTIIMRLLDSDTPLPISKREGRARALLQAIGEPYRG
jgi:hypothetical protein